MTDLERLAKRLGNPLTRGGAAVSDPELLELLAHADQLSDLCERAVRIARTALHDAEDGRCPSCAVTAAYRDTLTRTTAALAEFRVLATELRSVIPTH